LDGRERVADSAAVGPATRTDPVPQQIAVRIIAQDPSVLPEKLLTVQVRIPAEHLDPGPRGTRFHVVDYDNGSRELAVAPTVLDGEDGFEQASDKVLLSDPGFRAQNVYATAASTLAAFEAALGRRLAWGFPGHQLYLVPHAFPEANAFYSPQDRAIYFGYVPDAEPEIQTALSHDIVAHETTHAILDGLRPRYIEPGLPDQLAFHEALGDCVALLSVFSFKEMVAHALISPDGDGEGGAQVEEGRLARATVGPQALRDNALFVLADQLGVDGTRGSGLRRSVRLEPSTGLKDEPEFQEPHRRGEILVAAVMQALLKMWSGRVHDLPGKDYVDFERVAQEGAKSAWHLLRMIIRGIDYMPPAELEFEDVLDAMLTADEVMAPDDGAHNYRAAVSQSFAAFGIAAPERLPLEPDQILKLRYERVNFAILRSDRDEALRFLWENAEVFGIERGLTTEIEFVRPSIRAGPDGLIVSETIVGYTQQLELTAGEAEQQGLELPAGVAATAQLQIWGSGVVVFDQFGRPKFHHSKPVRCWRRQARRFAFLASHGLADGEGRLGFSSRDGSSSRFAALHVPDERAKEAW
jgi:hypothetical protein